MSAFVDFPCSRPLNRDLSDLVCPNIAASDSPAMMVLAFLFTIAGIICMRELFRNKFSLGVKVLAFRNLFVILCASVMIVRAFCIIYPGSWNAFHLFFVCVLTPLIVQLAMLSVVVVFLARIAVKVSKNSGSNVRFFVLRFVKPLALFLIIVVIALCLHTCYVYTCSGKEVDTLEKFYVYYKKQKDKELMYSSYTIYFICYFALMTVYYMTRESLKKATLSAADKLKVSRLALVTLIYSIVFIARFVWAFLASKDLNPLQDILNEWLETGDDTSWEHQKYYLVYMSYFTVLEVIPGICAIIALHLRKELDYDSIPKGAQTKARRRREAAAFASSRGGGGGSSGSGGGSAKFLSFTKPVGVVEPGEQDLLLGSGSSLTPIAPGEAGGGVGSSSGSSGVGKAVLNREAYRRDEGEGGFDVAMENPSSPHSDGEYFMEPYQAFSSSNGAGHRHERTGGAGSGHRGLTENEALH